LNSDNEIDTLFRSGTNASSTQIVNLGMQDVKKVTVGFPGATAVSFLDICIDSDLSSSPSVSAIPSLSPIALPSDFMTDGPSITDSDRPSFAPSSDPSSSPSISPSSYPSIPLSSNVPRVVLSSGPSQVPGLPTMIPTTSLIPSTFPSDFPSPIPSGNPSLVKSVRPSFHPSVNPSLALSHGPSTDPTTNPTDLPSHRPSSTPSLSEVPSVSPSRTCVNVHIDFNTDAAGNAIGVGQIVHDEWESYAGLHITASPSGKNTSNDILRVFDTASPGQFIWLGSPNNACPTKGPGFGDGGLPIIFESGLPNKEGINCNALDKVLIIQEGGNQDLSPSESGGSITFSFTEPVAYLSKIGLLNLGDGEVAIVDAIEGNSKSSSNIIRGVDVNAAQTLTVGKENIQKLVISFPGPTAVTHIDVCIEPETLNQSSLPSVTLPQSASPIVSSPSNSSPRSPFPGLQRPKGPIFPAPVVNEFCKSPTMADFNTDRYGNTIPSRHVKNDWVHLGFAVVAAGYEGYTDGHFVKAFNSSVPGEKAAYGSPNSACPGGGPGVGSGGVPGQSGENCEPIGNLLLIEEDDEIEDVGATLTFIYFSPVDKIESVGVFGVGTDETIIIEWAKLTGETGSRKYRGMGENSMQKISLKRARDVLMLSITFSKSGAVAFIEFCTDLGADNIPDMDSGIPSLRQNISTVSFEVSSQSQPKNNSLSQVRHTASSHPSIEPSSQQPSFEPSGVPSFNTAGVESTLGTMLPHLPSGALNPTHHPGSTSAFPSDQPSISSNPSVILNGEPARYPGTNPSIGLSLSPSHDSISLSQPGGSSHPTIVVDKSEPLASSGEIDTTTAVESWTTIKQGYAEEHQQAARNYDGMSTINLQALATHKYNNAENAHTKPVSREEGQENSYGGPRRKLENGQYEALLGGTIVTNEETFVHEMIVDRCTFSDTSDMVKILSQNGSTISFSISPTWHNCAVPSRKWMAVDYLALDGDLRCDTSTEANCGKATVFTAKCEEQMSVIDIFAHAENLSQTNELTIEAPMVCNAPKNMDKSKLCNFRFVLECGLSSDADSKRSSLRAPPLRIQRS